MSERWASSFLRSNVTSPPLLYSQIAVNDRERERASWIRERERVKVTPLPLLSSFLIDVRHSIVISSGLMRVKSARPLLLLSVPPPPPPRVMDAPPREGGSPLFISRAPRTDDLSGTEFEWLPASAAGQNAQGRRPNPSFPPSDFHQLMPILQSVNRTAEVENPWHWHFPLFERACAVRRRLQEYEADDALLLLPRDRFRAK